MSSRRNIEYARKKIERYLISFVWLNLPDIVRLVAGSDREGSVALSEALRTGRSAERRVRLRSMAQCNTV